MKPKIRKNGILIIATILVAGLSIVAFYHFGKTQIGSQQVLTQYDTDTNVGAIASVAKSTAILIICVGFIAMLNRRRKKVK